MKGRGLSRPIGSVGIRIKSEGIRLVNLMREAIKRDVPAHADLRNEAAADPS
jgi:hypothetical protein